MGPRSRPGLLVPCRPQAVLTPGPAVRDGHQVSKGALGSGWGLLNSSVDKNDPVLGMGNLKNVGSGTPTQVSILQARGHVHF